MGESLRIYKIYTCSQCPFLHFNNNYGIEKAHRCDKIRGDLIRKGNYNPFDECINHKRYRFEIDQRCPLDEMESDKQVVICDQCFGSGDHKDSPVLKCENCEGRGFVLK